MLVTDYIAAFQVLGSDWLLLLLFQGHVFERAASAFVELSVKNLTDIPALFPPFELQLESLNHKIRYCPQCSSARPFAVERVSVPSHPPSGRKDLFTILAPVFRRKPKQGHCLVSWVEQSGPKHSDQFLTSSVCDDFQGKLL